MNRIQQKYPGFWTRITHNPISGMFVVRVEKYPDTHSMHNTPQNTIYVEVADSIEGAINKILNVRN